MEQHYLESLTRQNTMDAQHNLKIAIVLLVLAIGAWTIAKLYTWASKSKADRRFKKSAPTKRLKVRC